MVTEMVVVVRRSRHGVALLIAGFITTNAMTAGNIGSLMNPIVLLCFSWGGGGGGLLYSINYSGTIREYDSQLFRPPMLQRG